MIASGKSFRSGATLTLNSTCSSTPPPSSRLPLHPRSTGTIAVTFSFSATSWKSTVQHLAAQRVMLNIANERQTLATSLFDRQVTQQNFECAVWITFSRSLLAISRFCGLLWRP
jgi:hypothetical protein